MPKSWNVFTRDVVRLLRVPKAWIIVIGVIFTPALYAWFNINAFWDPYSNTKNIRVAIVNLDEGASSEPTGDLEVGSQIVDRLKENDQLGWDFMGETEAFEAVREGTAYAAIEIPADFSRNLISITTGEFTQPALKYYVNEKSNAIAPKITDIGASELDRQITTTFASQVAKASTDALKDAAGSAELELLNSKHDAVNAFDDAARTISSARESVSRLSAGIESSRDSLSSTKGTLDDVSATLSHLQVAIEQAMTVIDTVHQEVVTFTDAATSAYLNGTTLMAEVSAQANVSVIQMTSAFEQVSAHANAAIDDLNQVADANAAAISQLQSLLEDSSLDPGTKQQLMELITAMQEKNQSVQQILTDLKTLSSSATDTAAAIRDTADAMNQAATNAQNAADSMKSALTESLPALNRAMSALSVSASSFSSALDAQKTQIGQAQELLKGLDQQLGATSTALASLDGNFVNLQTGLETVRTDVTALSAASSWGSIHSVTGLNSEQIAEFFASPVTVAEHAVFPISNYGSSMAALFTNLSLWIGAFVLMVIFKIEVDTEGIEGISVREAFVGRFLLLAGLAAAQAIVVCIGDLIIGVQTVNALAFIGTGVLISLAYLCIVYALCVSFGHVGRGLCILLVIAQIPGASGIYPIEMMPGFFRTIYPFLPFTYGIDAMRETIAGFYDGHYWHFMGTLAVFVVVSFIIGLVLRRQLANLNRVFYRGIIATDLLIGEDVQVTRGGYRLDDVIRALLDRNEFGRGIARRALPFTRHYRSLLGATGLIGVVGLVVLTLIASVVPHGKATLLGIWTLWCLLIIGFLVVIEYLKQSFELAGEVAELSENDLRQVIIDGAPRRLRARAKMAAHSKATAVVSAEVAIREVDLAEIMPEPIAESELEEPAEIVLDEADDAVSEELAKTVSEEPDEAGAEETTQVDSEDAAESPSEPDLPAPENNPEDAGESNQGELE